jgi:hypothetical protein
MIRRNVLVVAVFTLTVTMLTMPPMMTAATAAMPAVAPGRNGFSMEVLVDGAPLAEYAARGLTYIEALEGREYSLRLGNRTGRRVAVALSVDGLNTIDAKTTTALEAAKWILDPYQTITIDGWQTSSSTARRFYFTSETESYGAWLGKTRNLGVISAALFNERPRMISRVWEQKDAAGSRQDAPRAQSKEAEPKSVLSEEHPATGIGQQVGHVVTRIQFDAEEFPAAVLEVRYEYRDALVRLGVVPRQDPPCEDPLARRERARGFEGMEFAPDPFRRSCP